MKADPEYLRLDDRRRLQTAVHRYLHQDGRTVTLIGTRHFAEQAYWDSIRETVARLEAGGAVVQCEGSGLRGDENTTLEEKEVLAELRRLAVLERQRIAEIGWVHQAHGLRYPAHWQVIDVSGLEVLRRLSRPQIEKMLDVKRRMYDWPDEDTRHGARTVRKLRNGLRLALAVRMRFQETDRVVTRRGPADAVLIDHRNTVALAGLDNTGRDTVLLWGVAHMPGIGAGLGQRGFSRCGDVEWRTAAQPLSIRSAVWNALWPFRERRASPVDVPSAPGPRR